MLSIAVALLLTQGPLQDAMFWEGFRPGMSVADARAAYPSGEGVQHRDDRIVIERQRVSDDCRADAHILHRSGSIEGMVLHGQAAIAGLCADAMMRTLRQRYGEPVSVERRHPFLQRRRTTFVWRLEDGVYVRFIHYAAGSGASALLDATKTSWELSVAANARPIRL